MREKYVIRTKFAIKRTFYFYFQRCYLLRKNRKLVEFDQHHQKLQFGASYGFQLCPNPTHEQEFAEVRNGTSFIIRRNAYAIDLFGQINQCVSLP